jgi:hypothetical protein
MNKVQFDYSDADLLMDTKLRHKNLATYCRVLSIPLGESVFIHLGNIGIIEVSYKQLQISYEYYNKTMRQWKPCEKVG